jgi:hypothetical protein
MADIEVSIGTTLMIVLPEQTVLEVEPADVVVRVVAALAVELEATTAEDDVVPIEPPVTGDPVLVDDKADVVTTEDDCNDPADEVAVEAIDSTLEVWPEVELFELEDDRPK